MKDKTTEFSSVILIRIDYRYSTNNMLFLHFVLSFFLELKVFSYISVGFDSVGDAII